MTQKFMYDEQIRRFLLQVTRVFSGFQVEYGRDNLGAITYLTVPVRYGDSSRQVQTIIQKNSANNMPSVPLMSFYIANLEYDRNRVQEPQFIDKMHVRQRTWDDINQQYLTTQGNAFTIERPMPVPYNLTIQLDIWTSNTNQKLQLIEQMVTLFNPSLEIQSTDNFIDWTSLSYMELKDVRWTSRTVPTGTEDTIDVATLTFEIPIWISPPARVRKLGVINKILAAIYDAKGDPVSAIADDSLRMGTRMQITPYGWQILLIGNQMQALRTNAIKTGEDELTDSGTLTPPEPGNWHEVLDAYGTVQDGISAIRLFNDEADFEVSGTIAFHPTDDTILLFSVDTDTIPANTQTAVNAVVDPLRSGPGTGLPAASIGQRYLLVDDIGNVNNTSPAAAWGPIVAKTNDVIEFDGANWFIAFDASEMAGNEYLTNLTTSIQYRWTGEAWVKSYEGIYAGGEWNIVI